MGFTHPAGRAGYSMTMRAGWPSASGSSMVMERSRNAPMVSTLVRRCSVTSLTENAAARPAAKARGSRTWSAEWGSTALPRRRGLEGEKLVDGFVGDGLRRLAALAQADERRGHGALVLGDQRERGALARAGPPDQLDLDLGPDGIRYSSSQALDGPIAHPAGDVVAEVGDPGDPP